MPKRVFMLVCCIVAMALLASAETCPTSFGVTTCTITDGNTTAVIDANMFGQSAPGIIRWTVDGTDYLFQQWFWFRVGDDNAEETIDMLSFNGASTHDNHTSFEATYGNSYMDPIKVRLDFDISDGPAPTLDEDITITNTSWFRSRDVSFFQYADFDLSADDEAIVIPPNVVIQTGNGIVASEIVTGPNLPDRWEVNQYPVTIEKLTDNGASNLSDQDWTDGDATWAFQWDFTLGAGDSYPINLEKSLSAVPEPASILLLGTALLLASRLRRKTA